jgi:hypothetical protein
MAGGTIHADYRGDDNAEALHTRMLLLIMCFLVAVRSTRPLTGNQQHDSGQGRVFGPPAISPSGNHEKDSAKLLFSAGSVQGRGIVVSEVCGIPSFALKSSSFALSNGTPTDKTNEAERKP